MSTFDLIAHQSTLEKLYNKNQALSRIKSEFLESKEVNFLEVFSSLDIPSNIGLNMLAQMVLHKRADLPTMVGLLSNDTYPPQEIADYLRIAAEADLIDWSPELKVFIVCFDITQDVQEDLDRYQYPLPMVVRPSYIRDNSTSGYLLSNCSVLLRQNHHNDDVVLDHLDRINGTKFRVNMVVVTMVKNQWRNLDHKKPDETVEDYKKRKAAFEKYDRTAKEVIELVTEKSDCVYLTHRYDKRGRVYCQGYHVNYQGNAWNKACIELYNQEVTLDE